jgi:hypothetical protein
VFYARLGATRASSVSVMGVAMTINAAVVLASAGLTMLLSRRQGSRGCHERVLLGAVYDA